jgi:hypothetical protein
MPSHGEADVVRDYGDRRGYYDFRNAFLTRCGQAVIACRANAFKRSRETPSLANTAIPLNCPDHQTGELAPSWRGSEQAFPNVPFDLLLARGLFGSSAVKGTASGKTVPKNLQKNQSHSSAQFYPVGRANSKLP